MKRLKNLSGKKRTVGNLTGILLTLAVCLSSKESNAQSMVIPQDYKEMSAASTPCSKMYSRSFDTKHNAIRRHLEVLEMNNIDTNRTKIVYDLNAPIFSHFSNRENYDIIYLTYVHFNEATGTYNSTLMECPNQTMAVFESDGFVMQYEPSKRRRHRH